MASEVLALVYRIEYMVSRYALDHGGECGKTCLQIRGSILNVTESGGTTRKEKVVCVCVCVCVCVLVLTEREIWRKRDR